MLNLVYNAIRYPPAAGIVGFRCRPGLRTCPVQLQLMDQGQGIAPDDLPRIFDRFYRGDTSRARVTGNAGLGLSIAHAIVEAHGGKISAESTLGMGTCFTVTLPEPRSVPTLNTRKVTANS